MGFWKNQMEENSMIKYDYLLQFYDKDRLDAYLETNDIDTLYKQCQPKQVCIKDVNNTNSVYFVDSPDGFVPVTANINKGKHEIIKVVFDNIGTIETSPFHMFERSDGEWMSTVNLVPGDKIISQGGYSTVLSIQDTKKIEDVYDLAVDHKNHRYYTNGVSSHNSGAGKSLFLQNFAVNWAEMGLNVVYLSLELSEKLCAMRLDAMISSYSTQEVLKNRADVGMRVGAFKKKNKGTLRIKQLKNGCTANDIKAFVKEYEIQTGIKVDAILLDYLDLCMPTNVKVSPSDLFVKDKYVSENLRDLAVELDTLFVTASQLNRSSHEEIEFDHSHISGGISKINTADNVVGIFTTNTMRENGRYQIQFMKTRSSAGVGMKVDLGFNNRSLRIFDLEDDDPMSSGGSTTAETKDIVNKLKQSGALNNPTAKDKDNSNSTKATGAGVLQRSSNLRNILKNIES